MCDCFHLAFPNWHADSAGTGGGRRLRGPGPAGRDDSICDEPSQFTEGERPRPQGSSPIEEYPEKYTDSDQECETEYDSYHKGATGKKPKRSGLGSMFAPKMSKLKNASSPETEVIVKTARDGCAEGLVYGGGGKDGIFIREVVPESPASKSLNLKEGDQVLSATVYFDNMTYEDAMQILEHAQAYKLKLCLKRKPEITETEPALESVIPEEEVYAPDMREQGKTKRRSDARISWPKFSSLGKGRKSHFTRSHSSSEADEQRKLELSPTTSDTESPIKSQDALKGKKRHKSRFSGLKKRGRISSSEDQDTDTTVIGQVSGKTLQTDPSHGDLQSSPKEKAEVYIAGDQNVPCQSNKNLSGPEAVHHKVELITLDSTLKTTDLTVALAEKEIPSGIKSPDGKKKKERSELKIKILGKDKSNKKDGKAKPSPKRLKTLGASIEMADEPEKETNRTHGPEAHATVQEDLTAPGAEESSKVISAKVEMPKVEFDISDVAFLRKSPHKTEEKKKKGKDKKQKIKADANYKLPNVGLNDVTIEETTQETNTTVGQNGAKLEQLSNAASGHKDDPYEQLSRAQLPKREEIEIPGMEDIQTRSTAKGMKAPTSNVTYKEHQSDAVQMSIDVDSVKEAISKLPGYKLPKVDVSGVPIPEEITVIDANAQRISVKTPTKVATNKEKGVMQVTTSDISTSQEISKTTVKLPKIPSDLTAGGVLTETRVDFKGYKTKAKETEKGIEPQLKKREDRVIPGKESTQIGILQINDPGKVQETEGLDKKSEKEKKTSAGFGITKPEMKFPQVGMDFRKQGASKDKSPMKLTNSETMDQQSQMKGLISGVNITDIDGIEYIDSDGDSTKKNGGILLTELHFAADNKTGKYLNIDGSEDTKLKMGTIDMSMPKVDVTSQQTTDEVSILDVPTIDASANTCVPSAEPPEITIGTKSSEASSIRFKMPSFKFHKFGIGTEVPTTDKDINTDGAKIKTSAAHVDVNVPGVKAELSLPDAERAVVDQQPGLEQDAKLKKPRGSMPKFSFSKSDVNAADVVASLPDVNIAISESKEKEEVEGVATKPKDVDLTLPKAKLDVQLPEVESKESSAEIVIKTPEIRMTKKPKEESPSKFWMPTFKLPKFGVGTLNATTETLKTDAEFEEGATDIPKELVRVNIEAPKTDIEGPSVQIKSTEVDHEGRELKFKMPSLGFSVPEIKKSEIDLELSRKDVDMTLPEANDVQLPETDLEKPSAEIDVKAPEINIKFKEESSSRFKMPTFKFPKFGASATLTAPEKEAKNKRGDINGSEEELTVDIEAPKIDIKGPVMEMKTAEVDHEGKELKFKMPSLGFSLPQVKQPEIDLRLSQKDVDVTLPEANVEVQLPEVDLKKPSAEIEGKAPEIKVKTKSKEDSPSRFKMPTIKLPKLGVSAPSVTIAAPEKDVKLEGGDINVPEEVLAVDVKAPKIDIEGPSIQMKTTEGDHEGKELKFKMPSLGFSVPQVKQPEIDLRLSQKDVDVTLPEASVEVQLPEVDLKKPSAKIEGKAPEINIKTKSKEDSPSRFKMPTFKFPKFGASTTMTAPEKDVKLEGGDINIPDEVLTVDVKAPKIDIEGPSIQMKTAEVDHEGKELKFKMPSLGFSLPQREKPELDLSLSHKDVDVTLPEASVEVQLPEVDLKKPSVEIEGKAPEIKVKTKSKEDSPSRFKMPTFKLPKLGVSAPSVSIAAPEKDVKVKGGDINVPEEVLIVDIEAPKFDIEGPSIDMKAAEVDHEGKELKFKMPSLGFSLPQREKPEIDLSLSQKEVDVTLPEASVEVQLPEVDLKKPSVEIEGKAPEIKVKTKSKEDSPSRFKMPTFKLPKLGVSAPSVSIAAPEKDVKVKGGDINVPEEVLTVDIEAPKFDIEGPSIDMKAAEVDHEGKELKFKMPSLGFSLPQREKPEIDLSLSQKEVDVTLPEASVEVQLPEVDLKKPSVEIEGKAPEIKVKTKSKEDSPSRFKMPTFKLPKLGVSAPSVSIAAPEKDVKVKGGDINVPEEVLTVDIEAPKFDIEGPSIDMKAAEVDHEGKELKFKMPSFGFSLPQREKPEIDLSLSQKEVDVTLPEASVEVQLPEVDLKKPSVEIEGKAPEIKVKTKSKEDSPSRFKMPTIKLPKLGVSAPSVTIAAPEKDVKLEGGDINVPEEVLAVDVKAPKIDIEGPSIQMKTTEVDHEGKELKFKMPSLGFSVPQVKQPEIDLRLSQKDVDVTLPEANVEVQLPEVDLKKPSAKIEGKAPEINIKTKSKEDSPSRFKMPTFKFPKFGASATMTAPEKDVKLEGGDINIPDEVLTVDVKAPKIDIEGPSIQMKTAEVDHEGKELKFKMPSLGFSLPQREKPEIDLSLSQKDVDVTLPEASVEVQLPEVDLKKPSAEIEGKAPEIKVKTKSKEDSPSRFKMPTFKLPKLGVSAPSVTIAAPEKDVKFKGGDINVPEEVLTVDIEAPKIDIEGPSIDMKAAEVDHEGKELKFKMPSLGFSLPQGEKPELDLRLSQKEVDVTLPETNDVQLPEVDLKKPSAKIEGEAPEINIKIKSKEDSPSRFKMPTFKFPKFGASTTMTVPEKDVKLEGGDINIPDQVLAVDVKAPKIDIEGPSIQMKTAEVDHEGKELKFKMPSLGFSLPQREKPEIDLSLSQKDFDVTLPEANVEVQLPEVDLKKPSAEIEGKAPEIKVKTKSKEDSPSRFKMPTIKLPKLGVSAPSVSIAAPEKDVKVKGGDINVPEEVLTVDIEAPKIDIEGPSIDMKAAEGDHEGKELKFKMPSLGFSRPQREKPEIDLRLSQKEVDVTLPEASVEVPEVDLKKPCLEIEGRAPEIHIKTKSKEDSPSRFKMPTFKFPKFGASATVTAPEKDVKLEGGDFNIPDQVLTVDVKAPKIDIEGPSIQMKTAEVDHEGKELKFKMPSLGFSLPQREKPEIDLSLSQKDVDVTLPEASVEVQLPEVDLKKPSAEIEGKAPEIKVKTKSKEDSPSRFKMPTFKLPKLGVSAPSVSIAAPEKDVKVKGGDINVPEEVLTVDIEAPKIDIEGPSIDMKAIEVDHEGKELKFKMPSLGFSLPQGEKPKIDLRLSQKEVDVTLPEANVEVQLPEVDLKKPSAKIEGEAPEINIKIKSKEDSPSRFKMPTFKLPKFGASTTMTAPEKDVKLEGGDINIPDQMLTVDIKAPKTNIKGPSIEVKAEEVDHEGKRSKLKMPSLGFSLPQGEKPEIDLSLSHKDVDVTLPEASVEVQLPEVDLKKSSAKVDVDAHEIIIKTKSKEDSPSRFKMPTFKFPKFGASATVTAPEKDVKLEGGDFNIPDQVLTVDVKAPKIDIEGPSIQMKTAEVDHEGKELKFKMPSLGFSLPQGEKPEIDLSLSQKDVDVTLPEASVEVQLPEVDLKKPSAEIEGKAPEIKVKTKSKEDSPSRFKMPTFKLPKLGVSAPSVSIAAPEKDVKLEGGDINVPEEVLTVDIDTPKIDIKGPTIEMKAAEGDHEGKELKFKMPSLGFSVPQEKKSEIDPSLSQEDVDVTVPEANVDVQLPEIELKEPSPEIRVKAPEIKVKSKSKEDSPSRFKLPTFKFPKFGASATMTAPEKDVKLEGSDNNISEEVLTVDIEGPLIEINTAEAHQEEKGNRFEIPSFGSSHPQVKQPEFNLTSSKKVIKGSEVFVNLETHKGNLAATEAKLEVLLPDAEVKEPSLQTPAAELDANLRKSKFSLSGFYFSKGSGKETEMIGDLPHVEVSLSKGEVKVKNPETELEQEADGQQIRFKVPQFGIVLPQVKGFPEDDLNGSKENVDSNIVHTVERKLNENVSVSIKSPGVNYKTDDSKATLTDAETANPETNSLGLGSPSKFKLPSFKMPKLNFSRPKPQDEFIPVESESKEEELKIEIKLDGESKTSNVTLVHQVLNNSGFEFDGPERGKGDYLEQAKAVPNIDEALTEQKEMKGKELTTKQDITKSPERTGWFKFPKFGLSSPSSPAKTPESDDKKCPVEKMFAEDISPTSSVQSSDAFADISSALTSETVGLSLSSPTKVTVKYSDSNTVAGSENIDSKVIMSTTRTEQISVEPDLPEKITILSSGVSSSSEDTLRLESRKIHVITSNMQVTPETQHAMLLNAAQLQATGGPHVGPEMDEAASWTVKDSQGGKKTIFERHLVKKTSSERSESKETVVITKQITRTSMIESSEPISGETATSVQRLRQSVHSEKMRFFDGAEK